MPDLTSKRVLVVGAAGGIGKAVVELCTASSATVVALDRMECELGAAVLGTGTIDVTDEQSVEASVARSLAQLGSIDSVVVTTGTVGRGWLHQTSLAEWHRVLDTNLTGVFLVLRAVLPSMLDRGGSIVTIGSTASVAVTDGGTAPSYAASKAGLLHLTRQVAVDYAPYGIRANCVCAGWVATELNEHSRVDAGDAWSTATPLPRTPLPSPIAGPATPLQIATAVRFLLSEDSSFMTGSAVMVDGGYTAL